MAFNKVTSTHAADGFTYTKTDYIDDLHLTAYILHQNTGGWLVQSVGPDDRPANADRTYNPPAYLLGAVN